jgi:GNAT superfamily N-acetyltransferase
VIVSIVVRDATPDELERVARLLAGAFERYRPRPEAAVTSGDRSCFERYLEDTADVGARMANADLLVADDAGEIVGTGALYRPHRSDHRSDGDGAPWPAEWAILRHLAVDPRYRGRGIGQMLAEARVERARALGATAAALHTSVVFASSRAMYQRLGWRRAPLYDFNPISGVLAEAYVFPISA